MERRQVDADEGPWVPAVGVRTCGTSDCFYFSLILEAGASIESEGG